MRIFKRIDSRINKSNEQIELCQRDVDRIKQALFGEFEDPICTNVTGIKFIPGYLSRLDDIIKRVEKLEKRRK